MPETAYENLSPFEKLAVNIPLLVCGTKGASGVLNYLNGDKTEAWFEPGRCYCTMLCTARKVDALIEGNKAMLRVLRCSKAMRGLYPNAFLFGGLPAYMEKGRPASQWGVRCVYTVYFNIPETCIERSIGFLMFTNRATALDLESAVDRFLTTPRCRCRDESGCTSMDLKMSREYSTVDFVLIKSTTSGLFSFARNEKPQTTKGIFGF